VAPTPAPGPSVRSILCARAEVIAFGSGRELDQLLALRRHHGDVVRLQLGGRVAHLIAAPDDIQHVLQGNHSNYVKGRGLDKTKRLLGEGLLTSEGEMWRRQRRLAQPAFHRHAVAGLVPIMTNTAAGLLAMWDAVPDGTERDVAADMMRLSLDIAARTLFSSALTAEERDTVGRDLPPLLEWASDRSRAWFDVTERLPTPSNRAVDDRIARLDAIVYRIIEERRRTGDRYDDLLGMLMAARDEDGGEGMDDRRLRDEVMTIFLAGHETTANLLAWTWMLLSLHPAIRRGVQEETDRVLGGRVPVTADADDLPYIRMVLDESLRLYPPAWAFPRRALGPDTLGGHPIPAGTQVIISPWVTHRHPALWEDPEGFDPERFTPQRAAGRPRYAYLPFGGGPRLCIGSGFALLEATVVVAMLAGRYELDLVPGLPIVPEASVTLRPRGGLVMRLRRRRSGIA
jgi:cytochrome P450